VSHRVETRTIALCAIAAFASAALGCRGTRALTLGLAAASSNTAGASDTAGARLARGAPGGVVDDATWAAWSDVDYLAIGSRDFLPGIEPLLAHRRRLGHRIAAIATEDVIAKLAHGEADPAAFTRLVSAVATQSHGKLRFVLLLGDAGGPAPIPAHWLPKLAYDEADGDPTPRLDRVLGSDEKPTRAPESYPSDRPYALAGLSGAEAMKAPAARRLAVGRVPARSREDAEAFARKIVGYETSQPGGAWQRRLTVFTGPAGFGGLVDGMIERTAERLLDDEVSYDFDVRFFFAAARSPYAYRFDLAQENLRDELRKGALIAGYVGHGASTQFDEVEWRSQWWKLGDADDAIALDVRAGSSFFVSLACDTGAIDRPERRPSLAVELVLNEHGAIAAFASSRESHPYANALYGQAILATFVNGRPRTLGEGVLEVQDRVRTASIGLSAMLVHTDLDALKAEHEGLYNLFGDPATRLRYADALAVKLASASAAPGARLRVEVKLPGLAKGRARVTLETRRTVVRGKIVDEAALDALPEPRALEAMEKNAALANDKVVLEKRVELEAGAGVVELDLPRIPGAYVVKAISEGDRVGIGHADLVIAEGGPRANP
jgi:HSP20 family molecular chaperone IbpA